MLHQEHSLDVLSEDEGIMERMLKVVKKKKRKTDDCDPEEDEDCKKGELPMWVVPILIFIVLLVIGCGIFYKCFYKKGKCPWLEKKIKGDKYDEHKHNDKKKDKKKEEKELVHVAPSSNPNLIQAQTVSGGLLQPGQVKPMPMVDSKGKPV